MTDPVRVRASSWGELLDCAHRWEAKHLLGMTMPTSSAGALGTALHKSTATFDKSRMSGTGLTVNETAAVLVDSLANPEYEVTWDEPKRDLEKIGLTLHTDYCRNWSPKFEFVGVEMETKPLDIDVGGFVIRLTGTMDRARAHKTAKGFGIDDVKSGKRAVDKDGKADTKSHGAQLGVYELLFEHTTGETVTEPANIIGMRTGNNPTIGMGQIVGAKQQIIGWPGEPGLLEMGAHLLKAGIFPPNPRSQLCSPKFCPRWNSCRFHD